MRVRPEQYQHIPSMKPQHRHTATALVPHCSLTRTIMTSQCWLSHTAIAEWRQSRLHATCLATMSLSVPEAGSRRSAGASPTVALHEELLRRLVIVEAF